MILDKAGSLPEDVSIVGESRGIHRPAPFFARAADSGIRPARR
jgi:hypothetical protein